MAIQTVNIGTTADDGAGDPLRTAFDKINDNFLELYAVSGAGSGNNIAFSGNKIISEDSSGDITLDPNGTGKVIVAVPSQTTVGSAGSASAPPARPTTYLKIRVHGTEFAIPAYAVS
jgi:hypothetical protein